MHRARLASDQWSHAAWCIRRMVQARPHSHLVQTAKLFAKESHSTELVYSKGSVGLDLRRMTDSRLLGDFCCLKLEAIEALITFAKCGV